MVRQQLDAVVGAQAEADWAVQTRESDSGNRARYRLNRRKNRQGGWNQRSLTSTPDALAAYARVSIFGVNIFQEGD